MAETYEGKLELLTEAEFIEHSRISVGVHLGRLGKAYRQIDVGILLRRIHQTLSMSAIAIGRKPPALAPTIMMADRAAAEQAKVDRVAEAISLELNRQFQATPAPGGSLDPMNWTATGGVIDLGAIARAAIAATGNVNL